MLRDTLYSFIIVILFFKNRLNLTEENKKQEPCGQHSTMSSIKYQNFNNPKIWIIPKNIKFYQNDTQKSGNTPENVPKIMAHPRIVTYASNPPPPPPLRISSIAWRTINMSFAFMLECLETGIKFSKMPTSKGYNKWS